MHATQVFYLSEDRLLAMNELFWNSMFSYLYKYLPIEIYIKYVYKKF